MKQQRVLTLAARIEDVVLAKCGLQQLHSAETEFRRGGHLPNADILAREIHHAEGLVARLSETLIKSE